MPNGIAIEGGRLLVLFLLAAAVGFVVPRILWRLIRDRVPEVAEPPPPHDDDPAPDAAPRSTTVRFERALLRRCSQPLAWVVPLAILNAALPVFGAPVEIELPLRQVVLVLLIASLTWLVMRVIRAGEDTVLSRFPVDVRDNLRARRVHTQAEIIRKILVVAVAVVGIGFVLMTFEPLRQVGTGLLASAGLAGLVIGLAAQRTLGNLLAGIQIALTQPMRLDDVVIVEGEWGWIEEITLTYVVVRVWDLRRLILPISWFIENPFQNWTRSEAKILGTVFFYVDYTVPVGEVREELGRIVESHALWDGVVWRLHVTEVTDRAVELRCLMSAADSPSAWELRCDVREGLLDWLQRTHPEALPRVRAELDRLPEGERAGALGSGRSRSRGDPGS